MGIRRGGDWGAGGALPDGGVVVSSDGEARGVVEEARRRGEAVPVLGLAGGDLCRTLGGSGDLGRLREGGSVLTCDLGSVLLDGRIHWFTAHLVARRSWLSGRILVVMNAAFLGRWNLGPRAHPGDGLLDISDADLSLRQRLAAWRRLPAGTHLPHPAIATTRRAAFSTRFERPVPVLLDGVAVGRASTITVRVESDALTVVV
ncbi:MAG: hypothetical protein OXP08_09460 [bacterium]|nr:hypothetical protein [bacterium]